MDSHLLEQLPVGSIPTPEVISAAYARISRSKKSIGDLHTEAAQDVHSARESNQTIVFEMGHASISEHAVFNIDLVDVSRLMCEWIQRSRLGSYTEKSLRYVTMGNRNPNNPEYLVPQEIIGTPLEKPYRDFCEDAFEYYASLYGEGRKSLRDAFHGSERDLRIKVKEDARYVLPLCTLTQMGMTMNARSLTRLMRRLDRAGLDEARQLREKLREAAYAVALSLIRYTQAGTFERELNQRLPQPVEHRDFTGMVSLLDAPRNADSRILAGMLFERDGGDPEALEQWASALSMGEKERIFGQLERDMQVWDVMPRAFELATFRFRICVSSSCFAQLKRHRMATLLWGKRTPELGFVEPELLTSLGEHDRFSALMQRSSGLWKQLEAVRRGLGDYALTSAHRIQVVFQANLRELFHFSRLRSDAHAQWEIRALSHEMDEIVRLHAPLSSRLMMGKDRFEGLKSGQE